MNINGEGNWHVQPKYAPLYRKESNSTKKRLMAATNQIKIILFRHKAGLLGPALQKSKHIFFF